MASADAEVVLRRRMSRTEFDELSELEHFRRAEYVAGVALMPPPAMGSHNFVGVQLLRLLADALPNLRAVYELGVETPTSLRVPDVALVRTVEDRLWVKEPPVLVAEVLSRSTRSEDLFRKPAEYQAAGIGQYWIIDREQRTLTVLVNSGEAWDVLLELDADHPTGTVGVGEYGTVSVDLTSLLA